MCDCYYHKCEFCNKEIDVHIGDYSTSRDNVSVVCPWCIRESKNKKAIKKLKKDAVTSEIETVYLKDIIRLGDDMIGRLDDKILIVCRDPDAYSVSVNQ